MSQGLSLEQIMSEETAKELQNKEYNTSLNLFDTYDDIPEEILLESLLLSQQHNNQINENNKKQIEETDRLIAIQLQKQEQYNDNYDSNVTSHQQYDNNDHIQPMGYTGSKYRKDQFVKVAPTKRPKIQFIYDDEEPKNNKTNKNNKNKNSKNNKNTKIEETQQINDNKIDSKDIKDTKDTKETQNTIDTTHTNDTTNNTNTQKKRKRRRRNKRKQKDQQQQPKEQQQKEEPKQEEEQQQQEEILDTNTYNNYENYNTKNNKKDWKTKHDKSEWSKKHKERLKDYEFMGDLDDDIFVSNTAFNSIRNTLDKTGNHKGQSLQFSNKKR